MTFIQPYQRFGVTQALHPTLTNPAHRIMYDAIGANASVLVQFRPQLVLGYDTGSGGIPWSGTNWALFPGIPHVHVDQAGQGAPVYSANVMDVEPGAYSPADVPGWMAHATAPRPTEYCDRNDCATILANGYKGPIMLAWPGWSGEPLPGGPGQVVAVQNVFQSSYDASVVLDPAWPYLAQRKVTDMPNGQFSTQAFVPFAPGSGHTLYLYRDFQPVTVRVAVRSVSKGYGIQNVQVKAGVPSVVHFADADTDTDAVSLVLVDGAGPVGYAIV